MDQFETMIYEWEDHCKNTGKSSFNSPSTYSKNNNERKLANFLKRLLKSGDDDNSKKAIKFLLMRDYDDWLMLKQF